MSSLFSKTEIAEITTNNERLVSYLYDTSSYSELFQDFEIRDDDVFLVGNPKSGTTWLSELVWLIGNDLDFQGAKTFIDERFPILELGEFFKNNEKSPHVTVLNCHSDSVNYARALKSPRFIKSHLQRDFLPRKLLEGETKAKIIYISRNSKDTCLSSYHYSKNVLELHNVPLDDFAKLYMYYGDRLWLSVLQFWSCRNDENVLFLRYEEMKTNLEKVIEKVAKFLNKSLTQEQTKKLLEWLQLDRMKLNDAVNHKTIYKNSEFIRKGQIGGYKNEMSPEIVEMFNRWNEEFLKNSDYVEYDN